MSEPMTPEEKKAVDIATKFALAVHRPDFHLDTGTIYRGGLVQAIASALLAEREAAQPQWRTIDSAPRDGRDAFLLLTNTGVAWTGAWDGLEHCWRSIDGGQLVVTHYMPLPPLPTDAGGVHDGGRAFASQEGR